MTRPQLIAEDLLLLPQAVSCKAEAQAGSGSAASQARHAVYAHRVAKPLMRRIYLDRI